MNCVKCGAPIVNGSNFCEKCGTRVSSSLREKRNSNKKKRLIISLSLFAIAIVGIVFILTNHHFNTGTVYSYSQYVRDGDIGYNVKNLFIFLDPKEYDGIVVIWLMSTPQNRLFPIGFGKRLEDVDDRVYEFEIKNENYQQFVAFRYETGTAQLLNGRKICGHWEEYRDYDYYCLFFNDGDEFPITKEIDKIIPSNRLVGSSWEIYADSQGPYDSNRPWLRFKSWNEVVINEDGEKEIYNYICIGDELAIKVGDNLCEENSIGTITSSDTMTLFKDGLEGRHNRFVKLRKVG